MTNPRNLPAVRRAGDLAQVVSPWGNFRNGRAVERYARQAVLQAEIEMIDTAASAEVAHMQLGAEMALYVEGRAMAGGDPGLQRLAANKTATFAESNNSRLASRYR